MGTDNTAPPPHIRIAKGLAELGEVNKDLKRKSRTLCQPVDPIEKAFQRQNVRVTCWTPIADVTEDGIDYRHERIGWAEIDGEWHVVLKTFESDIRFDEETNVSVHRFEVAPYYLQAKGIDKLPELVEALVAAVKATSERIAKKLPEATALNEALTQALKK
jgi:hypothetical protein